MRLGSRFVDVLVTSWEGKVTRLENEDESVPKTWLLAKKGDGTIARASAPPASMDIPTTVNGICTNVPADDPTAPETFDKRPSMTIPFLCCF
jgi:hypothetical protein